MADTRVDTKSRECSICLTTLCKTCNSRHCDGCGKLVCVLHFKIAMGCVYLCDNCRAIKHPNGSKKTWKSLSTSSRHPHFGCNDLRVGTLHHSLIQHMDHWKYYLDRIPKGQRGALEFRYSDEKEEANVVWITLDKEDSEDIKRIYKDIQTYNIATQLVLSTRYSDTTITNGSFFRTNVLDISMFDRHEPFLQSVLE